MTMLKLKFVAFYGGCASWRKKASLLVVPENPTEEKVQIPDDNICFGSYFFSLSLSAIGARTGYQDLNHLNKGLR
ncbi:hypothetical protein K1719_031176 [Acacia pycnantha]|nr:hypothetical protein K1719_031176 [Acacia pycnantha]